MDYILIQDPICEVPIQSWILFGNKDSRFILISIHLNRLKKNKYIFNNCTYIKICSQYFQVIIIQKMYDTLIKRVLTSGNNQRWILYYRHLLILYTFMTYSNRNRGTHILYMSRMIHTTNNSLQNSLRFRIDTETHVG